MLQKKPNNPVEPPISYQLEDYLIGKTALRSPAILPSTAYSPRILAALSCPGTPERLDLAWHHLLLYLSLSRTTWCRYFACPPDRRACPSLQQCRRLLPLFCYALPPFSCDCSFLIEMPFQNTINTLKMHFRNF